MIYIIYSITLKYFTYKNIRIKAMRRELALHIICSDGIGQIPTCLSLMIMKKGQELPLIKPLPDKPPLSSPPLSLCLSVSVSLYLLCR